MYNLFNCIPLKVSSPQLSHTLLPTTLPLLEAYRKLMFRIGRYVRLGQFAEKV